MKWSSEQENIFELFDRESCNVLVNAAPGSGKTTLQNELWQRSSLNTVYLAFNTSIVKEAKEKLVQKPGSDILTLHSLGHRACAKAFPGVYLDKDKVYKIIKSNINFPDRRKASSNISALLKLLGLMKTQPLAVGVEDMRALRDEYYLDWYRGIEEDALKVWERNNADLSTIDYGDQLSFPVLFDLELPKYQQVLGDEIQDFNTVQTQLIERIRADRYILVGDKRQSIYAFRGALSNSVEYLRDTFSCREMPMTLTYRCPRSVVEVAKQYYPNDINAPENAQEGIVRQSIEEESYSSEDMMLCRSVAPLVAKAFSLLRQRVPCNVRGRDIAEGLVKYIKRLKGESLAELSREIHDDIESSVELAKQQEDTKKIERLQDKLKTLDIFLEQCSPKTKEGLLGEIEEIFKEGRGITLSTIHKAKGLEAERVFLLKFGDIERYKARLRAFEAKHNLDLSGRLEQEVNGQYVAVTRAKKELVYV